MQDYSPFKESTLMTHSSHGELSFALDVRGLDDGPPFLGIGFLQGAQGLRSPSFGRKNLASEIDDPRSHRWIGQRPRNGCVETANYLIRCALGREKSNPTGTSHCWQS